MVGNNGTMMAIRIVRSKLRKREEHSNTVHPADVVLQTPTPVQPNNNYNNNITNSQAQQQQQQPPTEPVTFRQQPLWQFPPPLPPPYVYTNDQDTLMQPIGNERASFRNLRKNIGGRWRRLVKRKPEQEVYTIPPELKPQLKQIYVY